MIGVAVGVAVAVAVGVLVGVLVGVFVGVNVAVAVDVAVDVGVGVNVAVAVGVGPTRVIWPLWGLFGTAPLALKKNTELGGPTSKFRGDMLPITAVGSVWNVMKRIGPDPTI